MYHYRLFEVDGTEAGEAHYAVLIAPGETIWTGDGRKLRVVDLVPVEEEDSPFTGFLKVEPEIGESPRASVLWLERRAMNRGRDWRSRCSPCIDAATRSVRAIVACA
jgi:hypothetical protein